MASEGRPRVNTSRQHSKGPELADRSKMAGDVFHDGITDVKLCESLMLKDALVHRPHLPYLPTTLIFPLRISFCLTVSEEHSYHVDCMFTACDRVWMCTLQHVYKMITQVLQYKHYF